MKFGPRPKWHWVPKNSALLGCHATSFSVCHDLTKTFSKRMPCLRHRYGALIMWEGGWAPCKTHNLQSLALFETTASALDSALKIKIWRTCTSNFVGLRWDEVKIEREKVELILRTTTLYLSHAELFWSLLNFQR